MTDTDPHPQHWPTLAALHLAALGFHEQAKTPEEKAEWHEIQHWLALLDVKVHKALVAWDNMNWKLHAEALSQALLERDGPMRPERIADLRRQAQARAFRSWDQ